MLPKTLLKAIFFPTKTLDEIVDVTRQTKESGSRHFSTILSPLVVWVIVVVLPYLVLLGYFVTVPQEGLHVVAKSVELHSLKLQSVAVRFAFVFGSVAAWPLTFATVILLVNKKWDFTKRRLKTEFLKQCLVNSLPVPLLIFPVFWFGQRIPSGWLTVFLSVLATGLLLAAAYVFFRYQYFAVRHSLENKRLVILTISVSTVLSFLTSYLLSWAFVFFLTELGKYVI